MMTSSYSLSDALVALETYGADFGRWPDQALAAFAQDHAELQTARFEAEQLDGYLSAHTIPAASDLLGSRILKSISQMPQEPVAPIEAEQDKRPNLASHNLIRMAALFLVSAIIGGTFYMQSFSKPTEDTLTASVEAETDAWLIAANDLDLVDIFLWVETDENTG